MSDNLTHLYSPGEIDFTQRSLNDSPTWQTYVLKSQRGTSFNDKIQIKLVFSAYVFACLFVNKRVSCVNTSIYPLKVAVLKFLWKFSCLPFKKTASVSSEVVVILPRPFVIGCLLHIKKIWLSKDFSCFSQNLQIFSFHIIIFCKKRWYDDQ